MTLVRHLALALIGGLVWTAPLSAQTGSVTGRVVDATTQQPIAGASVTVEGTRLGVLTGPDGRYVLQSVQTGARTIRASTIGYGAQSQSVTVAAGQPAVANFQLQPEAVQLEGIVATGYGTQRREAITGSVATVDAEAANEGVVESATEMIQGRVAGVNVVMNNGEPGAGAQIRIRGGTSISASNEPLYVIDGVPINNVATEPGGVGIGGSPPLARNPLNLINPNDIESISILKDASATAIYGSRGANGVVLITTKNGAGGPASIEYDGYYGMSTAAGELDLLSGAEYRQFIQQQVQQGNLPASRLQELGQASTNWWTEITRSAPTQNHNLSFSGGEGPTRYRASLNYMDQEGVVMGSGFERVQGRLNGAHAALNERLRLGLNLTASRVDNDYLPYENTGGFEGAIFTSAVVFNPTRPVVVADPATGGSRFFEIGGGAQSVRNPVAMAEQLVDLGVTTRVLGNVNAELDVLPSLTASVNLGVDQSDGIRRMYFPRSSPVGAEWQGRAVQVRRDNETLTFQSYLTLREQLADIHNVEVVGGYEFNDFGTGEFGAEGRGFLTDAFLFNNLGGGSELIRPFSWREESRLASFFTRANYSFQDRYFLTGVLRYDGSSRFGAGNKWALFPAISASWRITEEPFMQNSMFSDLRIRAGYGVQGNQAVSPYASLILLSPNTQYPFGESPTTGVVPVRNPNPNLKWEETGQWNVALDYGLLGNRLTGTLEYYDKKTTDLLLEVTVPQPALVSTRFENIGSVRNRGVEFSLDGVAVERPALNWMLGLVFAAERNEVVSLGGRGFITTGDVSGQGQTGQTAQRIMPGFPLGTFFGPRFVRVDPTSGKQLFVCSSDSPSCVNGVTPTPTGDDFEVLGNANPDFSLGLRSQLDWGNLDFGFLVRGVFGQQVFNNTALVYATKGNALQDKNFLAEALNDPTGLREPAIFSSRWIEDGSFVRLQNMTLGYRLDNLPRVQNARVYIAGDNLLLLTDYSGLDPEVHTDAGLASRGIDYLNYPRARTITAGVSFAF